MHQTMFAISVAMTHAQPSTGLTCSLIALNGRCPVVNVTNEIALSMMTPRIIASGCNHIMLLPANTPR